MNRQQLIDRFCESRHRWLIVTAATLLLALVTVLPQVDQFMSLRADEIAKAAELSEAQQTAELLPRMRQRVEQTGKQLTELEARTLQGEMVSDFRSKLVEMVRESGCQMRRLSVEGVRERRWRENDRPLAEPNEPAGNDTPFQLETRPVNLSVTGTMEEVRTLLRKIEVIGMMTHARGVDLRPAGRDSKLVHMDLELWCFALSRGGGKA